MRGRSRPITSLSGTDVRRPFDGFGQGGVVYDIPAWELGESAWSDALNIRFRDGAAESQDGHTQVFGNPLGAMYRIHGVGDGAAFYWVYTGTNRVWATDGGVHADISSVSRSYSATDVVNWNGGAFQRHMILNTGNMPPQAWIPNLSGRLSDLPAWEAGLTADVIRPFRNYLFALRCTEAGTYNPRLLRHSNGATAGNLPTSWDYTDPDEDTGRVDFGQSTDVLIDAVPLRDLLVVYKETHTWAAQWTGGVDNPFEYRQVFNQVGALSQYCATPFEGQHFVLGTDDVVVHDLNGIQSILDKRARTWLFNQIDPTHYRRCFVAANHRDREMWVCFPEAGESWPTMALVWNWVHNTLGPRELGQPTPHIAFGVVSPNTGVTFDTDDGLFDGAAGSFDEQAYSPAQSSLLMADPTTPALLQVDASGTFAGAAFTKRITRSALPFGELAVLKRIMRVIPKIQGAIGTTVNVSIGTRSNVEGVVSWSLPQVYTVGTSLWVDFRVTGRIIDIRFETTAAQTIRVHGFDIEFDPAGRF